MNDRVMHDRAASALPFDVAVLPDAGAVAREIAARFVALARDRGLVAEGDGATSGELHVAVSGGSMATEVVPAMVEAGESAGLDWSRVHVWFADERFVPRGHDDRNAVPIVAALRAASGFDEANLHVTLTSDLEGVDVAEAARAYEHDLRETVDALDLVLLGAGPDGHTASLFPGHLLVTEPAPGRLVLPISDSPKPPPERVTLTFEAIAAAPQVWAVVTGAGKADAVATACDPDASPASTPLGTALRGREGAGRMLVLDEAVAGALGR